MFNPLKEILTLDIDWLAANGWTLRGILAYRHLLWEYNNLGIPSQSRIIELIEQYDAAKQANKIRDALQDLLLLKQLFSKPVEITDKEWEKIISPYL